MKTTRKMNFNLPITKAELKRANREIAKSARVGDKLEIEWKFEGV